MPLLLLEMRATLLLQRVLLLVVMQIPRSKILGSADQVIIWSTSTSTMGIRASTTGPHTEELMVVVVRLGYGTRTEWSRLCLVLRYLHRGLLQYLEPATKL